MLTSEEALRRLEEHDVPCAPVRTAEQVLNDRQFWDRGTLLPMRHGGMEEPVKGVVSGFPVLFSGGELPELSGAPTLGMHNQEIFTKLLGLGEAELEELAKQGVV
jgi:crotonobetainyl-CoA:carnitine CoA-transferase CaiB-like acyl-CoA transferase